MLLDFDAARSRRRARALRESADLARPHNTYINPCGVIGIYGSHNMEIVNALRELDGEITMLLMRPMERLTPTLQIEYVRDTRHAGEWRISWVEHDIAWTGHTNYKLHRTVFEDGILGEWFANHPRSGPLVETNIGSSVPAWVYQAEQCSHIAHVPRLEKAVELAGKIGGNHICEAVAGGFHVVLYAHPSVFYHAPIPATTRWRCAPPIGLRDALDVHGGVAVPLIA